MIEARQEQPPLKSQASLIAWELGEQVPLPHWAAAQGWGLCKCQLCSDPRSLQPKLSAQQWTQTGETPPQFYMDSYANSLFKSFISILPQAYPPSAQYEVPKTLVCFIYLHQ